MSTATEVLVTLHVLCVIFGFGYLAYSGLQLLLARRRSLGTVAGVLEVGNQAAGFAELLIYAAFLFGLAALGSNSKHWSFSDAWVLVGFILYLVDIGLLHGFIRPRQRRYMRMARELAARPAGERPAELDLMETLTKQIAAGWGVFNVVVVVVVAFMVTGPK